MRRHISIIAAAGLVPFMAACGPSALEIYERFEADLVEELRSKWNATPTGGCPEVERWSLRGTARHQLELLVGEQLPNESGTEFRARGLAAVRASWMRSIPARQCWCIQHTVLDVRYRLAVLDPGRFADVDPAALDPPPFGGRQRHPTLRPSGQIAWATGQPGANRPGPLLVDQFRNHEFARGSVDAWNLFRFGRDGALGWEDAAQRPPSSLSSLDTAGPFLYCDMVPAP